MQNKHSIYVDLDIDKGYVALSSCLNFKDGSKDKPVTENRDLYFYNSPSTWVAQIMNWAVVSMNREHGYWTSNTQRVKLALTVKNLAAFKRPIE